jgi:FAD/FMN-containing dehydrogenase
MARTLESWGRFPSADPKQQVITVCDRSVPHIPDGSFALPYGNGRSYGDVCLNDAGYMLYTKGLNRTLAFDESRGLLKCESGVLLKDILSFIAPKLWFLPVVPGTGFVTLGGAIANDVHGKNHHVLGSFGLHVTCLELLRSDGQVLICSPNENSKLFRATIGGLGLTGLITWAEIQLIRIPSQNLIQEIIPFSSIEEYIELAEETDLSFEYSAAWLDLASKNERFGRGLLFRANFAPTDYRRSDKARRSIAVPSWLPFSFVNRPTINLFNKLYYSRQSTVGNTACTDFRRFFFPLDTLRNWNHLYGPRGFTQYQCVVPIRSNGRIPIKLIIDVVRKIRPSSSLAVAKLFGDISSLGLLSFARRGVTLAMDFPNKNNSHFRLMDELDDIVIKAGGAVYLAKDARMSTDAFRAIYPEVSEFSSFIDPRFSSTLWRRLNPART